MTDAPASREWTPAELREIARDYRRTADVYLNADDLETAAMWSATASRYEELATRREMVARADSALSDLTANGGLLNAEQMARFRELDREPDKLDGLLVKWWKGIKTWLSSITS